MGPIVPSLPLSFSFSSKLQGSNVTVTVTVTLSAFNLPSNINYDLKTHCYTKTVKHHTMF